MTSSGKSSRIPMVLVPVASARGTFLSEGQMSRASEYCMRLGISTDRGIKTRDSVRVPGLGKDFDVRQALASVTRSL